MKRLNLSAHAFTDLPDELPLTDEGKLNIMFQYRWHAAAKPSEKTTIKTVVVYGEHPGLNAGDSGELGTAAFINRSVDKILAETKAPLGKLGFSAYSGGGIALYNLFKQKDKLIVHPPDAVILSDAGYGGNAVMPVWTPLAKEYLEIADKKFVMLHTRSLEASFDSTTKTANALIRGLNIKDATVPVDKEMPFWKDFDWSFVPNTWTQKGSVIILDTDATHGDAGKIVPQLWNSFLADWF